MKHSVVLGSLGVVVTAGLVSYLGYQQRAQVNMLAQTTSSVSMSSRSVSSSSMYRDCQNSSGGFGPCSSSSASSTSSAVTSDLLVMQAGPASVQLVASGPVALSYSVIVQNNGMAMATAVEMIYPVPPTAAFVSSSNAGCKLNGTNILCILGNMAPGAAFNITFQFSIKPPATCADTTIQPKAFGWSTTVESNMSNNVSGILTRVLCPRKGDVLIRKNGQEKINKGLTLSYSLTALNYGPDSVENVKITDVIPAGLTFLPQYSDRRCAQSSNTVVCAIGTLTNLGSTNLSLAFQTSGTVCGGRIKNTAAISTTTVDPVPANNQATVETLVECPPPKANLEITKYGPPSIARGATAKYTIGVLNNGGPDSATDVTVTDAVPAGMSFVPSQSSPSCTESDDIVYCNLGTLASNQRANLILTFQTSTSTTCGVVNNTAIVSTTTQDTNAEKDTSTAQTMVNCSVSSSSSSKMSSSSSSYSTAQLSIAVKSIGTSDTAVKNSKNINLFRFEARANEADDILFTSAVFNAQAGSLLNAQNYALWVDTNADSIVDTILEKGINSSNNEIIFSNMVGGGYVIPKEKTVLFEVHADVAANLINNTLQLKFFSEGVSTYIHAEMLSNGARLNGNQTNGSCNISIPCQIIVTTTPSKLWNLVSQGDLFITKDTESVRSRQLLGGTLGDPVLRLNFRAQNEDIDVTDLQISTWDTIGKSVDRLELYKPGQTVAFAIATIGGCGSDIVPRVNPVNGKSIATFCANMETRQLVVPRGQDLDVIVKPRIKPDLDGAISGEMLQFWIAKKAISNNATGEGAVRARGSASSNELSANNGNTVAEGEIFIGLTGPAAANNDIVGNPNQVVLSKITSIINANPDAANTPVPTGVYSIGRFRFTAATNANSQNGVNSAVLTDIIFTLNATNVAFDKTSLKLYNTADSSTKTPCVVVDDTGTSPYSIACWNIATSPVNSTLYSGASSTFALEATITNPKVSNTVASSLQVKLERFSDITLNGVSRSLSHIRWQDKDIAATTFYWIEYPDTVVNSTLYKS